MILITGATGHIGRHVVRRLLAEGWPIRCYVGERQRRAALPWDTNAGAEVVYGSVLDEEALFRVVNGVHAVIHLESAQWWGRQRDLERVELVGTRNLIGAARAARVGRIIVLSHLGATPSSAFTLLRSKGQLEDLVRGSGLAYTIIRSGLVFGPEDAFFNHIAMMLHISPVFLMPGRGEVVLNPIYIDDLVEVLNRTLMIIETVDETLEIGGPEYVTLDDMIRTMMRVTGAYRPVVAVPPYVLRWITAVYNRLLPRPLMTQQWLDLLATNRTAHLGNTYNYFGIHPRRFEDTLLTYIRQRNYLFASLRYSLRRRPRSV